MTRRAYRASVFHLTDDPATAGDKAWAYYEDGAIVVEAGEIADIGPWSEVSKRLDPTTPRESFSSCLIAPGFIDAHVHFPQLDIIGAYGSQLLEWLERYAFPAEMRLSDADFAALGADLFLDELLRHGTTSALVFATVHAASADALFAAARKRKMRLITGKVLMDKNAPAELRDTPESAYAESKALIEKWHGVDRLSYAVTPRFAHTSSPEQLAAAGRLLAEHPDIYLHTHLSESQPEIAAVHHDHPDAKDYLGVYEGHGLVRERSMFAHCVHLSDDEWSRMGKRGAAAAFCPSSNMFLGSGLFDLAKAEKHGVPVGLATDVGGGTSLSLLEAMEDAYKVCQLRGRALDPFKAFYLATLGAARALKLDSRIGNLQQGKEADFVVLDLAATQLMRLRLRGVKDIAERLFALAILGDDRAVARTYVAGELVHARSAAV